MLDITICILSYNRASYLREAINSVLAQTRRPKRIVICDNGSDSRVYEEVKEFENLNVEWIGSDRNHSFIWNFSRAMALSKTTFTMLLHDDDRLPPEFLEKQVGFLEKNPSVGAISCNGFLIDAHGNRTGRTLSVINETVDLYEFSGQVAIKYASDSCVPFSPAIYRTAVAASIKLREDFGKVCDATYFCDLSDVTTVGYQNIPLYECRDHVGQDSKYFPDELMDRLEDFFVSRTCKSNMEKNYLVDLLNRQHSVRTLKKILIELRNKNFIYAFQILRTNKLKIKSLTQVALKRSTKRIRNW